MIEAGMHLVSLGSSWSLKPRSAKMRGSAPKQDMFEQRLHQANGASCLAFFAPLAVRKRLELSDDMACIPASIISHKSSIPQSSKKRPSR